MGLLVVRIITITNKLRKSQHKSNIGIGWNKRFNALFSFFNGWFKLGLSNICGGTQILEMVIFMDISAVSEPILIKQR